MALTPVLNKYRLIHMIPKIQSTVTQVEA